MPLTRDFKETIRARVRSDPDFRKELLREGLECLLGGDVETGKAVLRNYINAGVGFQELGRLTGKTPKSLMRMFGPTGEPDSHESVCRTCSTEEAGRLQSHNHIGVRGSLIPQILLPLRNPFRVTVRTLYRVNIKLAGRV